MTFFAPVFLSCVFWTLSAVSGMSIYGRETHPVGVLLQGHKKFKPITLETGFYLKYQAQQCYRDDICATPVVIWQNVV